MPDWKRIIVGDAFKLPSRSFDYYRDTFLLWPILAFSALAIINILSPESPAYRMYGFKLAACAIVALALAKERLMLIGGVAGYVAIRTGFALAITRDWKTLGTAFLVSAGTFAAILWLRWDSPPAYQRPVKLSILGVTVGVAGLGIAFAIGSWLKP